MSGIGPILLFDKSTLQSLSVDESVWFDALYYPNITPLFFVETLADLDKEVRQGRTPEEVVGNLAEKTPTGGHINVYHEALCIQELLTQRPIEMARVAIVAGGRPVRASGAPGMVFEEAPERAALRRWEEGEFLEVERDFARVWRQRLSGLNLDVLYREGRFIIDRLGRPTDLTEAHAMATRVLEKPGSRYAQGIIESLPIPRGPRRGIMGRWYAQGGPPITTFAPFTAHVATVDLFFCIALGADLISRERPSNKIDMAYLYYLPFAMGFTSSDKLHARTAPLFMDTRQQVFVPGSELKADLAKLDAHYSALPDDVKERGVMTFARYPPTDGDFLTAQLWDKLMSPRWRQDAVKPTVTLSPEAMKKTIERFNEMKSAPRDESGTFASGDTEAVVIRRVVPVRRGKWRLLPPGVENETRDD